MLKLLQLKYPQFPVKLSVDQAGHLVREHCHLSKDYLSDLSYLRNPNNLADFSRNIQFPFVAASITNQSAEAAAAAADRRREAMQRLQEAQAQARKEKLAQKEEDLERFKALLAAPHRNSPEWEAEMTEEGFETVAELEQAIKRNERSLQKAKNKEAGIEEPEKASGSVVNIQIPRLMHEARRRSPHFRWSTFQITC